MPVVTRSCGRKATTRKRIEDPTPRACRTTVKRKKDVSDEEIEKPPQKKHSIDKTEAASKTVCDKKNEGIKKSRIPRRCLSEKKSVRGRSQIANNRHHDDDDDNAAADDDELVAKKKPTQTRRHTTKSKDHNEDEVDELMTGKKPMKTRSQVTSNEDDDDDNDDEIHFKTTVEEKAGSPQEMDVRFVEQQTPLISPVASRTRSYSVLKKSYMRKKQNKEIHKTNAMDGSLISTSEERDSKGNDGKDSLQEREMEAEAPHQVTEIDSSTCDDEHNPPGNSNDKVMNDDSFKKKFLEVVQTMKKMQEEFDQAHQKTCENIAAYDAFIKDLKSSLEQEKRKNATIEEELKQTREQLFMTQKEIEWAKTNEQQQQHEKSISSSALSSEPSQSEETSQSESGESGKTKTSTLLAMIKFYTELTGITLSTDIPPSNSELIESFCCAYRPKGPSGQVMQFRLMYDKEIEEYEYSPRFQSPKRGEFLHKLSEHFKDNFYFTNDQAHSFLASLIKAVKNL